MARRILWRMNVPFRFREQVTALVRHTWSRFIWPSATTRGGWPLK